MRCLPILLCAAAAVFGLSACSADEPTGAPILPPDVTIAVTYLVTPGRVSTPVSPLSSAATDTPLSPAVTPTPLPIQVPTECPAPGQPTPPTRPEAFADMTEALLPYLNAGASITATRQLLTEWGVVPAEAGDSAVNGGVLHAGLWSDHDPQLVVVLANPAAEPGDRLTKDLAVFRCAGGTVQLIYHAASDPAHARFFGNLRLLFVEDVTGDGNDELGLVIGECGVHTCYDVIEILSAGAGGGLANIVPGFTPQPYPTFSFTAANEGAGRAPRDLLVRIGFIGSLGAGPQRTVTEVWSYDGAASAFVRADRLIEPPVYRIHALHDADAAFRKRDFETAAQLYQRVIADPGLRAWEDVVPLRDEDQVLGAFARFRLIELAAAQGDAAGAQSARDALIDAAPAGSPGELYAQMGEVFHAVYTSGGNYAQACQAAAQFAERNPNAYILLGSQTFGYANYDYQPRDMCIALD